MAASSDTSAEKTTAHTPGPWTASSDWVSDRFAQPETSMQVRALRPHGHDAVCYVKAFRHEDRPEAEANALLIARAPAMFAALQTIRDARDEHAASGKYPFDPALRSFDDWAADIADAAIDAATGS
jgi:hypothetical protein